MHMKCNYSMEARISMENFHRQDGLELDTEVLPGWENM